MSYQLIYFCVPLGDWRDIMLPSCPSVHMSVLPTIHPSFCHTLRVSLLCVTYHHAYTEMPTWCRYTPTILFWPLFNLFPRSRLALTFFINLNWLVPLFAAPSAHDWESQVRISTECNCRYIQVHNNTIQNKYVTVLIHVVALKWKVYTGNTITPQTLLSCMYCNAHII